MKIARVVGTVVSTINQRDFEQRRLLICDYLDSDGGETGGGDQDLGGAQAEDGAPHDPQTRRLQFQSDDEKQQQLQRDEHERGAGEAGPLVRRVPPRRCSAGALRPPLGRSPAAKTPTGR